MSGTRPSLPTMPWALSACRTLDPVRCGQIPVADGHCNVLGVAGLCVVAVGIDACKRGWVAIVLRDDREPEAHFLAEMATIASCIPDATAIAIDIPVGLPVVGERKADRAAKAMLGPRQNSVFMTPVRAALEAASHAEATRRAVEISGIGISQQSYALRSKIFEVERWLAVAPCPVWEVHPEVSFAMMMGGPAAAGKKTWQGAIERRNALERAGIRLDHLDPRVGSLAAMDDVLDAAAAAWSARRLQAGTAMSLPDPPEVDDRGIAIAIWA